MKKLHLALDMSNLSSGGSISVLLRYMRYWQGCGVRMSVYYSRPIIREEIERNCLDVRMVEVCKGYPAWKTFAFRCFKLGKVLERDGVDLVYCVNSMLLRCSLPQVVHMRNLQHFAEPSYLRQLVRGGAYEVTRDWVCRYRVRHADRCVYSSNYIKHIAERWRGKSPDDRHITIHNPVSEQHIELSQRLRPGDNHGKNLIIGVFNDYPHKDAPTFLRAVAMLREIQPENQWRAVIVGNGEWQSRYGALLAESGLTGQVDFPGYVPADRIAEWYSQAFCMMNASRLEAFNNTPLEAMALGCPVVISDCCSHREVCGDAALFCEPGNARNFAESILNLKQDRELYLRLRECGFRQIRNFLPEDSGMKFLKVLEDMMKDKTNHKQ